MNQILPFAAIVGQEKLKKALLLNAINPGLSGVLIKGEKGTAKSTAIRSLADLLPEINVVADCSFNCNPYIESNQCQACKERRQSGKELPVRTKKMPVVDLPLGATEDRVVGTIDLEKALHEGIKALEPGLLARVNQGVLYIDEVNLLDDHVVDVLLDAAAMGVNIVEREGVSLAHPARFILVGTMNPEEGELRPQLLDRFGLQVTVEALKTVEERIRVIEVLEEFLSSPETIMSRYELEHNNIRNKIGRAKSLLKEVTISNDNLKKIARVCIELNIDGHRGDILIARTARTIAAYNGRNAVEYEDIKEAMEFVLPHRLRRKPFQDPPSLHEQLEKLLEDQKSIDNEASNEKEENNSHGGDDKDDDGDDVNEGGQRDENDADNGGDSHDENGGRRNHRGKFNDNIKGCGETRYDITPAGAPHIEKPRDGRERLGRGKRVKTLSSSGGRYIKSRIPQRETTDIAVDATLRASAARKGDFSINDEDLREKVREAKRASCIVFVVDASGSMAAKKRMEAAKGGVFSLLKESYEKRDRVGFVAFQGQKAEVLLEPTSSIEVAANHLKEMPTGKRTPLSDGLYQGLKLLEREIERNTDILPVMVLVSDGRGNVPIEENVKEEAMSIAAVLKEKKIHLVVIDTEEGLLRLGYNKEIVRIAGGQYHRLSDIAISSENILNAVKLERGR